MKSLRLSIREPGTLLSRLLEEDISPEQYAQIVRLVREPNDWLLIGRDQLLAAQHRRIGFGRPSEESN